MSLLNGCAGLTTSSNKQEINKDDLPNGCEWVKPVLVPAPIVTYSLQSGQIGWLQDTQTNNENILNFCYKQKVEPKLDLENVEYEGSASQSSLSLSGSVR